VGAATDIAQRAEALKTGFVALVLSIPALVHPGAPLLKFYEEELGIPESAPTEVFRQDGTIHSDEPVGDILRRVTTLRGGGFGEDVLVFAAMHGATRLGDYLAKAGLTSTSDPLLQFARHFRNACAHGNRWHFLYGQPKHAAELRGRQLDASLHGSTVLFDWVAPGDYLDFLDDLAARHGPDNYTSVVAPA
jgi:hypothetical protein